MQIKPTEKMKRTLFAILLSLWSACAWAAGTVTVKGRVVCDGRGVANVRISDGDGFARTDEKGYYTCLLYTSPSPRD